jgi:hypothetical protein
MKNLIIHNDNFSFHNDGKFELEKQKILNQIKNEKSILKKMRLYLKLNFIKTTLKSDYNNY